MHGRNLSAALAAIALGAAAGIARAGTFDWNVSSGNYSAPGSWSPIGVPGAADTARFQPGTYNVNFTAAATAFQLTVNSGSNVTFFLNGNNVNFTSTVTNGIGGSLRAAGGNLTIAGLGVDNGGSLTFDQASIGTIGTAGFALGASGFGNLTVQGSTFTTNTSTVLGGNAGGNGFATVTGANSSWTVNSTLVLGSSGNGSLTVSGSGAVTANALEIGQLLNSTGSLSVSGAGSTFTTAGTADIGGFLASNPASSAVLSIGGGGTVNFNGATNLRTNARVDIDGGTWNLNTFAFSNGATVNWNSGTVNFADAGTVSAPVLNLLLGGTGTLGTGRTLSANGGTLTLSSNLTVNGTITNTAASAVVNVNAGLAVNGGTITGTTINLNSNAVIGGFGKVSATDTLNIAAGATVQVADLGTLGTANPGFNNGTLQLNGPAASVSGFFFNLGTVQGTGRFAGGLNNSTLGTLRARPGDYLIIDSSGLTNSGNIELSGGTIEYTHPLSNLGTGFISGRGEFRGGTSSPGGFGLSNLGVMAFSGGTTDIRGDVTNGSGGKIISAGGGVLTFYDDVIHNGAEIRTNAGSRTVFFGSQSGAGNFTGTGTVEYAGDLRPGNSPASVSYGGDVVFDPTAALYAELGGTTQGTQYDHITVAGTLNLDGGLNVTTINGFAPAAGQSFDLFDGTVVGTFSSVSLPSLSAGLAWDTSQLYSAGIISVQPVPEPAAMLLPALAAAGVLLRHRR